MGNSYDIMLEEGVACPVGEDEIREDCDFVLASEGVERPCMVSVSVVGDERMRELLALENYIPVKMLGQQKKLNGNGGEQDGNKS